MLNPDEIDLSVFPPGERVVVEEYLRRKTLRRKGQSFIDYVAHIAPWFVFEECHIAICEKLQAVRSEERRVGKECC